MALGRKGIFFSLSAILLVGLIFVILNAIPPQNTARSTVLRVEDVQSDANIAMNQEIPLILRVHAFQTMQELADTAYTRSPDPFDNEQSVEFAFSTCMASPYCPYNTGRYHYNSVQADINALEQTYNDSLQYDAHFSLSNFNITQVGPWDLYVQADLSLYMRDAAGMVTVNRTKVHLATTMSIVGLLDPYASRLAHQQRYVSRAILPLNDSWTAELIYNESVIGSYREDISPQNGSSAGRAPSYMQRLLANPQPSGYGIYSLMPPGVRPSKHSSDLDYETGTYNNTVWVHYNAQGFYLSQYGALLYNATNGLGHNNGSGIG